jgi:hypothetical protein
MKHSATCVQSERGDLKGALQMVIVFVSCPLLSQTGDQVALHKAHRCEIALWPRNPRIDFVISLVPPPPFHADHLSGTVNTHVSQSFPLLSYKNTYLNPSHIRRLLPERLTTHVESVLADEARFLLFAVDDTITRLDWMSCRWR